MNTDITKDHIAEAITYDITEFGETEVYISLSKLIEQSGATEEEVYEYEENIEDIITGFYVGGDSYDVIVVWQD